MEDKFTGLEKISCSGLEKLNIYEMLYTVLDSLETRKTDFIHIAGRIVNTVFFSNYEIKGNGDIAFVYTHSVGPGRNDHMKYFMNLCSVHENCVTVVPSEKFGFNFRGLCNIKYIAKWKAQIYAVLGNKKTALAAALLLYLYKSQSDYIYHRTESVNVIMTYCDALPIDYCLTFLCGRNNKKTVTVQHGFYSKDCFAFKYSHSGYFIANTSLSAEYAKNAGLKNIYVGGLYSDMYEKTVTETKHTGVFALILDGMSNDMYVRDNKKMLEITDAFSAENNIKYVLRYHPHDAECQIHDPDNKNVLRVSRVDETIGELLEKVDFVIVNRSSTCYQAVNKLVPVILFKGCSGETLPAEGLPVFSDYGQLKEAFRQLRDIDINRLKEIKSAILGNDDTAGRYAQIFNEIIMKRSCL